MRDSVQSVAAAMTTCPSEQALRQLVVQEGSLDGNCVLSATTLSAPLQSATLCCQFFVLCFGVKPMYIFH